jgi:hypothetical protein
VKVRICSTTTVRSDPYTSSLVVSSCLKVRVCSPPHARFKSELSKIGYQRPLDLIFGLRCIATKEAWLFRVRRNDTRFHRRAD